MTESKTKALELVLALWPPEAVINSMSSQWTDIILSVFQMSVLAWERAGSMYPLGHVLCLMLGGRPHGLDARKG